VGVQLKDAAGLRGMRRAGLVVADALAAVAAAVRPGVSTAELDAVAADVIRSAGAAPSFLGYHGFPAVTCISVNDEAVHGIPGERVLAAGDVVSIDCGAIVAGWHGDAAVTVCLPAADEQRQALAAATDEALWAGIAAAAPGARMGDIGWAVESTVAAAGAYGILEDYLGHGIGTAMHMPPEVPNRGRPGKGLRLKPGMALAIEPMVTLGTGDTITLEDGWTVVTADGSAAAHFEHTVAVTADGPWVLTAADGGVERLAALGVTAAPLAD
jgi:methionyl aminopeptidase